MPKHRFILPPFACGQQHMRFLFVTFLKMSPNRNSSGLRGLQVLGELGSQFELCGFVPLRLELGNVKCSAGKHLEFSALLKCLFLVFQE